MTPVMFVGEDDAVEVAQALVFHHNQFRTKESYRLLSRFIRGMSRIQSGVIVRVCNNDDEGKEWWHRKVELSRQIKD